MPSALDIGKPAATRGTWAVKYFGVTSGQTFKTGDHVYLDSSGTLAIAAAEDNDVGNVKTLGIALANAADVLAQPTGQQLCPVKIPSGDGEFVAQLYHSTAASAVLAETTMDAPTTLPLRNQDGMWTANVENNGTNDRVIVVERHPKYPFSEQYGWFWVRYMPTHHLYQAT